MTTKQPIKRSSLNLFQKALLISIETSDNAKCPTCSAYREVEEVTEPDTGGGWYGYAGSGTLVQVRYAQCCGAPATSYVFKSGIAKLYVSYLLGKRS